jgi:dihydroflavonol-4-reductase
MRVAVTGATGFIGANVARRLVERGDAVRCLLRKPNLAIEGLPVELRPVALRDDPASIDALAKALDGVEGVYHVAGAFDPGPGGAARMTDLHVFGTRALMRAAEKAGVRRVVLCSSSVTVGFGPASAPGDEDTPLDADAIYGRGTALRAYHDSKLQAEALVAGWGTVEAVIVNPDYILGAWDVKPTSGALVLAMARRALPVYPRGGKCFQHVRDCADGHILAMEKGQPGRRYLLGTWNLSYREFMGIVAAEVGRPPPRIPLPDAAVALAGRAGAWAAARAPGRFGEFDPDVLRAMQQPRHRSGARAERELGVPRTPIELAVREALQWFREHGHLPR